MGRLDYMSEGLLLFTNNGDFARKLELPSSNYKRVYKVCIRGKVEINNLEKITSPSSLSLILIDTINSFKFFRRCNNDFEI